MHPREEVLRAAFFANFASSDDEVPLFVTGPPETNLAYYGYLGPVIYLTAEQAEALRQEVGPNGPTYFSFAPTTPAQQAEPARTPGWVVVSPDGTQATVHVGEHRGPLNAVGKRIVLRCAQGRWYPLSVEVTLVS